MTIRGAGFTSLLVIAVVACGSALDESQIKRMVGVRRRVP
jgi:hypothetical protein